MYFVLLDPNIQKYVKVLTPEKRWDPGKSFFRGLIFFGKIFGYWSKIREILTESLLVLPSQYFVIFFSELEYFGFLFWILNIYEYFVILLVTVDYL